MGLIGNLLKGKSKKAEAVYSDKNRLEDVLYKSKDLVTDKGKFASIRGDLNTLFALSGDWVRGNYRKIDKKNMIMIIASLLYLVNPLDLVPDFIIGLGYLDDFSVFVYLLSKVSHELDQYRNWKDIDGLNS